MTPRVAVVALSLLACPCRGTAQTTVLARADTVRISADTLGARAIAVDFGPGVGSTTARTIEATFSTGGDRRHRTVASQVRLTRRPDSLTVELARRLVSGDHIARIEVVIPGVHGGRTIVLGLIDVQVVSARILASSDDVGLEQEVLALRESEAQLAAEHEEAERQLVASESLETRRLSAPLDVARARTGADVLGKRLAAQRARLALAERRLAGWSPAQEELVLTAGRVDVDTH